MTEEVMDQVLLEKPDRRTGEFRRIVRVMFSRWVVVFGFVVILVFVIIAIFAPLLTPYDPIVPD